jgi:hypothetical protein
LLAVRGYGGIVFPGVETAISYTELLSGIQTFSTTEGEIREEVFS